MTVYEFLSLVSSLVSTIIAFIAILLTRKTILESRMYNKLSVRPFLLLRTHLGGSQGKYGISVTNEGLGPALIKHCEVSVKSKGMKDDGDHGWNVAIEELNLNDMAYQFRIETIAPNGIISHGSRNWLFYINKNDNEAIDEENRKRLKIAIKDSDLNIKINYESMFGDKYEECLQK